MNKSKEETREQIYNLVKEVHIQKPFEDVTGEPHYVTDEIMKIFTTHSQNREAEIRGELLLRVLQEIDGAETEYNPARHGTEPHDVFDLVKKYVGVIVFDIYGRYDALIPEQLEDKQ